jgi:hypothetical protein
MYKIQLSNIMYDKLYAIAEEFHKIDAFRVEVQSSW